MKQPLSAEARFSLCPDITSLFDIYANEDLQYAAVVNPAYTPALSHLVRTDQNEPFPMMILMQK